MALPVHIISGFLGTGKTTLIRAQLAARPHEKLAVIVNDFGVASLDALTLSAGAPFQLTNIPGGCVCCTAPEGFVDALGAVLARAPDRLLIEPTGLARPQDLVDTIRRCPQRAQLELAPVVVLVDPARIGHLREEERALVEAQAGVADVLVANRSDLASAEARAQFEAWVQTLWPGPLAVHHTSHGRVPNALLAWPEGEGARIPERAERAAGAQSSARAEQAHAHDLNAAYQARSFRWSPERVFSGARLERALAGAQQGTLDERVRVARVKGIFRTQEGFRLLECAGGELHTNRSAHRRDSRADVILESAGGEQRAFDAAFRRIADGFESALLDARELEAAAEQIEIALPGGRVRIVRREELRALPDGVPDISALFEKRIGVAARVGALWDALELPARGAAVVCAYDGFASEPVPLEILRAGFLLHSENSAPLARERGGPFRLLLPAALASEVTSCANVKGVTRIVVRDA